MAFNIWCSVISEHDLISDFVDVVNYFTILADIIFIDFSAFTEVSIPNPPYALSG